MNSLSDNVAPGICKRCRHTERYAGSLLDGICGNCSDDLRQEAFAERDADWDEADFQQRLYNAREKAVYAKSV